MILSDLYKKKLLDSMFRGYQSFNAPDKVFIGMLDNLGVEITKPSYTRKEYDLSTIAWYSTQGTVDEESTTGESKIKNVANISWGTALETWGSVKKVRFYLGSSGLEYFCDLPVDLVINSGDTVEILSGDLSIGL